MPAYVLDIVARLAQVEPSLSPAERKVAAVVRADLAAATRASIADLAARARVSQPTVTRFCRAVGCESVRDFKLKLAQSLAVGIPYLRAEQPLEDDVALLSHRVMGSLIDAIELARRQVDPEALRQAIAAIALARRLDLYGQGGGSHSVIEDARLRLFRLQLPTAAYADGHLQRMSAATLGRGDVALAVSNSGRSRAVIESLEIARNYGATTIALTRSGAPLARCADIALLVDIPEDADIFKPTASRVAHMAVIDVLATGVAMARGPSALETLRRVKYALAQIGVAVPAPGIDIQAGTAMSRAE